MRMMGFRVKEDIVERLSQLAKQEKKSVSTTIRFLVEEALEVIAYKNGKTKAFDPELIQKKQKLEAEYKKNLDFVILQNAALLRLIVKESGKFTDEEAKKLLTTSQAQVEKYMKYYESDLKKRLE